MAEPPGPSAAAAGVATTRPGAAASGARSTPEAVPSFDHLAMKELRGYRTELASEETRVAYCRRVLAVQLDLTREGRRAAATDAAFRRALHSGSLPERLDLGRTAILALVPANGLPPVPDLAALGRLAAPDPPDAADPEAVRQAAATAATALSDTNHQLAVYQESVRLRIQAATAELIARYRERPTLAVHALPLTPVIHPRNAAY